MQDCTAISYNSSVPNTRIGVWRSQVARTLGVGEAVGSNPATPTMIIISRFYKLISIKISLWSKHETVLPH